MLIKEIGFVCKHKKVKNMDNCQWIKTGGKSIENQTGNLKEFNDILMIVGIQVVWILVPVFDTISKFGLDWFYGV